MTSGSAKTTLAADSDDLARAIVAEVTRLGLDDTMQRAAGAYLQAPADSPGAAELDQLIEQLRALSQLTFADRFSGTQRPEQAEALRRMLLTLVSDPRLVVVRLAEQLVRLRAAKSLPDAKRRALAEATRSIFAPLANRLGIWQLKWELEDLAFRYLQPDPYREIASLLRQRRSDREDYIRDATSQIETLLDANGISAKVTGRAKHIYSIYRKMQRKDISFERLSDISAVRILVADVPACYAALGAIHARWRYIPGEFDDYIANPKDNDYRSLHTAVIGPESRPLEVQIRTEEMHAQAELGVAAHWKYKEGAADANLEDKVRWLRSLLETSEEEPDAEFIDRVRSEMVEDRVYVFSPKGDLVDLPAGATPLDFAYHVHSMIGHRCRGAKVDGRMVPLTYGLRTGEQVEIVTGREPKPSRDWLRQDLGYLASGRSRAKLRSWFRQLDRDEHRREGRAIVERALDKAPGTSQGQLATRMGFDDPDKLFVALGAGDTSPAAVARALQGPPTGTTRRAPRRSTARASATVAGLDELLSQFARCCNPLPPEPIRGYVTRGRGVTIHRADCASLKRLAAQSPDRILEVTWGTAESQTYPVHVVVDAHDRQGLLRDLTSVLADQDISILATDSETDPRRLTARVRLKLAVTALDQLEGILAKLRRVPQVFRADRS